VVNDKVMAKRKAPLAPASNFNINDHRVGKDGKKWIVYKGKNRGKYWHRAPTKQRGRPKRRKRYPHVQNRYRKSPYESTLTNWMLMQENLDSKIFYHQGGYISAYCDRLLPVCYVVSNTLRIPTIKPKVEPLKEERVPPQNLTDSWLPFSHLRNMVGDKCMIEIWKNFDDANTGKIFRFAERGTHRDGPRLYMKTLLDEIKKEKKEFYYAFSYPNNPTDEVMMPPKERFQKLLNDLQGDKILAFNLLLVSEKLRPGMLVHKDRYVNEPTKLSRLRKLVNGMTSVDILENAIKEFFLIYNNELIPREDAINACNNEALRGAVLGFFCPGSIPAEWCVTYKLKNVVFYIEPCCGQAKWGDMLKRGKTWSQFAMTVMGDNVSMGVVPLVQEARALQLLKERNFLDIFTYKDEIAHHFWEYHFACAADTLERMSSTSEIGTSPYMPIWTMAAVLIQKDYNPFMVLREPDMTQAHQIHATIESLEHQMFDLITNTHEVKYLVERLDLLEHWGFLMTASIIRDSRFEFHFPSKSLEYCLIVELAIAIDKLSHFQGFNYCTDEIKRKVRRFTCHSC